MKELSRIDPDEVKKYYVDQHHFGKIPFLKKIEIGLYPSKEELQKEFIEENKSRNDICQKYGFSSAVFKRLTKFYGIEKSHDKILQNIEPSKKYMGLIMKQFPKEVDRGMASRILKDILK